MDREKVAVGKRKIERGKRVKKKAWVKERGEVEKWERNAMGVGKKEKTREKNMKTRM